jgi:hypothetical protein
LELVDKDFYNYYKHILIFIGKHWYNRWRGRFFSGKNRNSKKWKVIGLKT